MSAVNVVLNEWFSPASSNGAIIFSSLVEKELIRKVSFRILLVKILMTHSPRKQSRRNIVVLFSFTFVKVHLEVRILFIQLLISIFLTDTQVFFNITIKKLGFLVNVVGPCVQVLQELKIDNRANSFRTRDNESHFEHFWPDLYINHVYTLDITSMTTP